MRSRLTLWALLGLSCATPAAAQLASQTALVGTVTDSGGSGGAGRVRSSRSTPARATPTRRRRTRRGITTSSSSAAGTYEITVTLTGFQTFKVTGVEVATNQVVRTNVGDEGRPAERIDHRRRPAPILDTDSATDFGDDRQAGDRRAAAERPQRLESRDHDAGRARGAEQRYRPELQRRRPAGDPEQPVARRHQLLVQPARRDQHAADRRRGDGDSGPDRQHVGRVRLVSRRPHQRGDQERHQQPHGSLFEFFQDDALD